MILTKAVCCIYFFFLLLFTEQTLTCTRNFCGELFLRAYVIGSSVNNDEPYLILGWMENVECGVWKMRSIDNEECGKYGVWKMGVWKMRSMENVECGK